EVMIGVPMRDVDRRQLLPGVLDHVSKRRNVGCHELGVDQHRLALPHDQRGGRRGEGSPSAVELVHRARVYESMEPRGSPSRCVSRAGACAHAASRSLVSGTVASSYHERDAPEACRDDHKGSACATTSSSEPRTAPCCAAISMPARTPRLGSSWATGSRASKSRSTTTERRSRRRGTRCWSTTTGGSATPMA